VVSNAAVAAQLVAGSLADGQTVAGVQHWLVQTGGKIDHVEFSVDGVVRASVTAAPYAYDWDTTQETPGPHTLLVRALGADGSVALQQLTVTVAAPPPAG
jgi:hypothetical protein